MTPKPYNPNKIDDAIKAFNNTQPTPAEALLAAVKLMTTALNQFQKEAPTLRNQIGEQQTKEFAMIEFNELVYDIQDAVPQSVRIYNSLMRDKKP